MMTCCGDFLQSKNSSDTIQEETKLLLKTI